jgi:hypothetical protein
LFSLPVWEGARGWEIETHCPKRTKVYPDKNDTNKKDPPNWRVFSFFIPTAVEGSTFSSNRRKFSVD